MAIKRVVMSMALVVPAAAAEAAANTSSLAEQSASLRGPSMLEDCADKIPGCQTLAKLGQCERASSLCSLTCGTCHTTPPASDPTPPEASCTASWAHNCKSNPTCCEAGFTCYQKTPSWAACLQTCTPGIVQPGDDGKQIPWTCAVIGGGGQGPTPAPGPSPSTPAPTECNDEDEQCVAWAERGECSANPDYMHQSCRLSCGLCQP